jgi:hypothetical protein
MVTSHHGDSKVRHIMGGLQNELIVSTKVCINPRGPKAMTEGKGACGRGKET